MMVPPVPTPATSTSTAPSVSFQISGPVVFSWIAGLAGFSNWPGRKYWAGSEATISLAFSMAPFMPLAGSVSTSSAPRAFSTLRRSRLMDEGMVSISL
ncbi:hypothetical protein PPS11_30776 [Pseudomonas putida S11]|nr:hypothetical protein PPS11_30776 [Pseudomonas putida S11]